MARDLPRPTGPNRRIAAKTPGRRPPASGALGRKGRPLLRITHQENREPRARPGERLHQDHRFVVQTAEGQQALDPVPPPPMRTLVRRSQPALPSRTGQAQLRRRDESSPGNAMVSA